MSDQVLNDYDIQNMDSDALIAIDALESIVYECQGQYVSRRYLREKVAKVMSAIGYIASVASYSGEVQDGANREI
jgi:hypothetical protein